MSKCGSSSFVQRDAAMEIITAVFLCLLVVGLCTAEHGQLNGSVRVNQQLFSKRIQQRAFSWVTQARKAQHQEIRQTACRNGNIDRRIVGGDNAMTGEFPWVVAILADGAWLCGGSILTATWVLTAGHCVFEINRFIMMFGSIDIDVLDEGSAVRVSSTSVLHENYQNLTMLHDIALIRHKNPLTFSDNMHPVQLAGYSLRSRDLVDEPAIVCGWGVFSDKNDSQTECLLCASELVAKPTTCTRHFPRFTDEQHICLHARFGGGSCGGDSGSPLVWRNDDDNYVQIGIVSFGSKTCENGKPGVYSRVTSYLGWIKAHSDVDIEEDDDY